MNVRDLIDAKVRIDLNKTIGQGISFHKQLSPNGRGFKLPTPVLDGVGEALDREGTMIRPQDSIGQPES